MNKSFYIIIVGLLIISGFGAIASNDNTYNEKNNDLSASSVLSFSETIIKKTNENYLEIELEESKTNLIIPGQPILPKVVKTFELPFGARNVIVQITPNNIKERKISGEIRPGPVHLPLLALSNEIETSNEDIEIKDEKVYSSAEPYPSNWYSCKVGCGLNSEMLRVTHVCVDIYPVKYSPLDEKIFTAESMDIKITYEKPTVLLSSNEVSYDMVIITPELFVSELERLVEHKKDFDVKTTIKTLKDIYSAYKGRDKPEQIKYFIKDAIEKWDIEYVLLVGGLNSMIWANPRENTNYGAEDWYLPVRYSNFKDNPAFPLSAEKLHDPGVITDYYFADIYKEGAVFEDWNSVNDSYIAAWGREDEGIKNDTIDLFPDVAVGRLACRSLKEVKDVVDKIINYETGLANPNWFKRAVMISGDGFLDQKNLEIYWDTKGLPDGEYTIYAQSTNVNGKSGEPDIIHVTIDKSARTHLSINHDDHLRIDKYPGFPIAEITVPSEGDILGVNDSYVYATEDIAYCNNFNQWSDGKYVDGVLHIKGKSYDPRAYGVKTDLYVWVEDSNNELVFEAWERDLEMYYEGEWIVGNEVVNGGGGALYYMPEDFEKIELFASNGKLVDQNDVIRELSKGCGFAFMSGHGNPNIWGDHYPGVPGNRRNGDFDGLEVTSLRIWPPFLNLPIFPMKKITNDNKLPIVVIGGCHNSQFNVTMIPSLLDIHNKKNTWCHGSAVPECFSWYLIKMPNRGAIASIGNTGLGYGILGDLCTTGGLDGGICIDFFKQYGTNGYDILGEAYLQTQISYAQNWIQPDQEYLLDHAKSLTQWVLLGDPSLKIGGYEV